MTPVSHPGPTATTHRSAPARQTVTGARRPALFASWLQRSDAPDAALAAQAITATVRRFGIQGCVSRMAQEFGDHPDAAADRMRWIRQLTAEMPAWPRCRSALAARAAEPEMRLKPGTANTTAQQLDSARGPERHCGAQRREDAA
jgi:hypothetical protein